MCTHVCACMRAHLIARKIVQLCHLKRAIWEGVNIFICLHLGRCKYIHMFTCMYIYIYTWPHVFVYVFMCVYMRIPDCSQDRAAASFGEAFADAGFVAALVTTSAVLNSWV